jgi:hypothetical protein
MSNTYLPTDMQLHSTLSLRTANGISDTISSMRSDVYNSSFEPITQNYIKKQPRHNLEERKTSHNDTTQWNLMTQLLEKAVNTSIKMVKAAQEDDIYMKASSGNLLPVYLQELWIIRKLREDEWQELLTCIQASFINVSFEIITIQQCEFIAYLLKNYLAKGIIKSIDVETALKEMVQNGFNPWAGFAQTDD